MPRNGFAGRPLMGGGGALAGLLLFFGWIALELVLFAKLSDVIGTFQALLVVVLKSGIGLLIMGQWIRWRLRQLRGIRFAAVSGRGALEAVLLVVGAVFIVFPGLLLAGVGLLLVLPPVRRLLAARFIREQPDDVVDLQPGQWREDAPPRLDREP